MAAASKAKTVVEDMLEVAPLNPKVATTRNDRLVTLELDLIGVTSDAIERCVDMMNEATIREELTAGTYVSISNPVVPVVNSTVRNLVSEMAAMGVDVRV